MSFQKKRFNYFLVLSTRHCLVMSTGRQDLVCVKAKHTYLPSVRLKAKRLVQGNLDF